MTVVAPVIEEPPEAVPEYLPEIPEALIDYPAEIQMELDAEKAEADGWDAWDEIEEPEVTEE